VKPTTLDEDRLQSASLDEIHAALFGQLVSGHAQMALIFLGQMPHPETGQPGAPSPAEAKLFIDQLEMLESRTRGNLSPDEVQILRQALTVTRQAFAEVMDRQID